MRLALILAFIAMASVVGYAAYNQSRGPVMRYAKADSAVVFEKDTSRIVPEGAPVGGPH